MKNDDLTAILTALCEALDQNELMAFDDDSKLLLLVNKLLQVQTPFNTSPDSARNTSDLLAWFEQNGGVCKAKLLEIGAQNFGLQAVEPINEADAVVRIPEKILITADCGNCPELYVICSSDSTLTNMPNLRLALNLLNERLNPDSMWRSYINSIPVSYNSLLYFTAEHFQMLRPSPAFATCARLYCKLLGSYVYLYSKFFGQESESQNPNIHFTPENFTFAAFRWAISSVMTRQNNVPVGGGLALVPVLDMLNHDPHLKASVDFDAGQVVVYAAKNFAADEELRIFYGVRPNHDLFVHNGFALADNPSDSFYLHVPFKMVEFDDVHRKKLIQRLGLERDCFKLTLVQPLPKSLLACIHIEFASDETIEDWLKLSIAETLDQVVAEKPTQLGPDLYRKAYVWLAAQLGLRLRSYKERLASPRSEKADEITLHISTLLTCERRILEAVVAKLQLLLQK